MLHIKELTKKYGDVTIIKNISFHLKQGEITGLVGGNGAGKSTLLEILATLKQPDQGNILLNELTYKNKKDIKKIRKLIGFVPQELAIWEDFTVAENMQFFERLAWVNKSELQLRTLCEDMQLKKWHTPVKELSGGMKRKLNLAISLIHEPKLLLLDEPTVGIDLKSKIEIATYLRKLVVNEQTTILCTSHDMNELNDLCEKFICIGEDPFYADLFSKSTKEVIIC